MAKGLKKANRTLAKIRKDLKNGKKKSGVTVRRRDATIVLTQGAVAPPRRNFGSGKPGNKSIPKLVQCLDARVPRTLGLPRAVGPYTIIRTTTLHESSRRYIQFCPFLSEYPSAGFGEVWYNWCGVQDVDSTLGITATNNTTPIMMPMTELGQAAEVVPAAMTVQVMNAAALDSASGIFAMGRVNQALALGGSAATLTWDQMVTNFISFYSPRMLTGGKLCLRGVKCSSYPLDMSEYSNFAPLDSSHAGNFSWTDGHRPGALAPIVFVQKSATTVSIQFMITIEWRVRFDPGHPATATHTHHDTLADAAWNDVIKSMSNVGHGVEELSEDVAAGGALAAGVAAMV